jgi:predicted nucleotidyltransferase component of viral defense system
MLQTQAIEPGTLSILKELMEIPELQSFHLVGGTALALKYGHRTSVDLDLFITEKFEHQPVIKALDNTFGNRFRYDGDFAKWGIFCYIDGVKVDLVYYPHPMLHPFELWDTIRMYNDGDLAAMKLQAMLGRGKKKDFWDIAALLEYYDLSQMIDFHNAKFPSQMLLISIPQALVYFKDADNSDAPFSLKGQTWTDIKEMIKEKVRAYLR